MKFKFKNLWNIKNSNAVLNLNSFVTNKRNGKTRKKISCHIQTNTSTHSTNI